MTTKSPPSPASTISSSDSEKSGQTSLWDRRYSFESNTSVGSTDPEVYQATWDEMEQMDNRALYDLEFDDSEASEDEDDGRFVDGNR
jgi:hypothetical protein